MGIVEVSKPGISAIAGAPKTPVSWVLEATQLINAGNQLITSVSTIIERFKGSQDGGQVIQSAPGAKITKNAPAPAAAAPAGQSDQDLQNFFSTPDGMKKIVDAIDQLSPLIGDVKLSEVKNLINTAIGEKAPAALPEKKEVKKK